jgi:hypothetical protein
MLPGTFLYVYLGASAGNLLALRRSNAGDSPSQVLFAIGLLITLVLTAYLHHLAQIQLERDRLSCRIGEPIVERPHMHRNEALGSDATRLPSSIFGQASDHPL